MTQNGKQMKQGDKNMEINKINNKKYDIHHFKEWFKNHLDEINKKPIKKEIN
jgi:hypothetical protein